ncbi:hypothetical protein K469DRAFT_212541 [Zopfia rhizophila CBS 207.26]|uniref:Uncharacterized protein n=1 Tax=Zopfia rhizophila CBS 207.26 TaxID=1314779 RepID=A0A6A6DTM4_9PEZI|nr:hypothetical protein K469DRAFT_212541 [Zopfia rhizophila CBS 207.26]
MLLASNICSSIFRQSHRTQPINMQFFKVLIALPAMAAIVSASLAVAPAPGGAILEARQGCARTAAGVTRTAALTSTQTQASLSEDALPISPVASVTNAMESEVVMTMAGFGSAGVY